MIMTELTGRVSMFQEVPGRRYHNCQSLHKSLLHKIDHKAFGVL